MPPIPIESYECVFTTGGNVGSITLRLQTGAQILLPINSIQEQMFVMAMLSKTPVFYDTNTQRLILNWRPVGT